MPKNVTYELRPHNIHFVFHNRNKYKVTKLILRRYNSRFFPNSVYRFKWRIYFPLRYSYHVLPTTIQDVRNDENPSALSTLDWLSIDQKKSGIYTIYCVALH